MRQSTPLHESEESAGSGGKRDFPISLPSSAADQIVSFCIVRQAISAVAAFHGYQHEISHGALGPERLVVTSHGRVVITDHGLGLALEPRTGRVILTEVFLQP